MKRINAMKNILFVIFISQMFSVTTSAAQIDVTINEAIENLIDKVQASATEIDQEVDKTIDIFLSEIEGAEIFFNQASGILVFPRVAKVGIGIGVQTGEGALRVNGESIDYYRTISGSIGFQLGAQAKAIIIAFMTAQALEGFHNSNGWTVGVDGSVTFIDIGMGKSIDTERIKDPVVGFSFDPRGLMYGLTLEGSKIIKVFKE